MYMYICVCVCLPFAICKRSVVEPVVQYKFLSCQRGHSFHMPFHHFSSRTRKHVSLCIL